jgi:hypothetical protein
MYIENTFLVDEIEYWGKLLTQLSNHEDKSVSREFKALL